MQIKTFRAKSIQEALQLVREKLGPDACVLQTREVRGLIGRRLVEVEASGQSTQINRIAAAFSDPELRAIPESTQQSSTSETIAAQEPSMASQLLEAELRAGSMNESKPIQPISASDITASPSEASTTSATGESPHHATVVEFSSLAVRDLWNELLRCGVEPTLAASLLNLAVQRCAPEYRNDGWLVRGQLNDLVAGQLKVAKPEEDNPHEQKMIALVGPTGVGKTTLLGKIAAQADRESGLQIGIVTLDTWRGAAVEQLLEFAELFAAQVEVVSSTEQLAPALQRLREFDIVLIDTAGRSPNDSAQMLALKELLHIAQPSETHLVLSCNASQSYAQNAIDRFSEVGATHLCISKLDEGGNLGHWLAPLWSSALSLMYLTYGKDVERNLMNANARHFASILLGHASLATAQ
jgi:flagellar biosynthesis protein FlhF